MSIPIIRASYKYRGFTLVELSIVIVIIGLIVAGVVGGQTLVKQAQLRSVISEYNKYDIAANAFKLEYASLPGDMPNAYSYWAGNCAGSAATCNGNGNGRVLYNEAGIAQSQENFMAWRHLNLAELIPGSFTGDNDSSGIHDMTPAINVPGSDFNGGGWYYGSNSYWQSNIDSIIGIKNWLVIGSESNTSHTFNALFTPSQAKSIDDKVDDGIPFVGKVKGIVGFNTALLTNCTAGAGTSATYILTETVPRCQILFNLSATGKSF